MVGTKPHLYTTVSTRDSGSWMSRSAVFPDFVDALL
jgi:hypothetical protein